MKRMGAAVVLMLTACSQQPATPQPRASASAAAPVAADDDHATPRPGEQKTFRDWTVACDNVRTCAMTSLGTETDFPRVTLQLTRRAGPAGVNEIALAASQDDVPPPAALVIDGGRFPTAGSGLSGPRVAAIARALVQARAIGVLDGKGATIATISPAGASAALRYIDAEQRRDGTSTALVARGNRPEAAIFAPPALPRVRAVAFTGTAATLSPALLAAMTRTARCDFPLSGQTPQAHALADGTTLVLLPCSSGAYNEIDALFVIRGGKVAPAQVDAPSGFEQTGADPRTPVHSVINGAVDGGVLTSYAKGRGLGDCGVRQSFVWDGKRLRLVEQSAMDVCRGNSHYLTSWRARVMLK